MSSTAQRRGLEAPQLVSELRGDLDWIVMKALEKDRSRRYETANGLAMDIQRHLDNEPVVACPPSRLYRLQKMVRRNKLAFAATGTVLLALVSGLGLAIWAFVRERVARDRADEQIAITKPVDDFLLKDLLDQASSAAQADAGFTPDSNLTVRQALERAAERIVGRFQDQPLQEAAVRHSIGNALLGLGPPERAIPHLERAFELRRAKLGPDEPETLASMGRLAWAYILASKLDLALPLQEEVVRRRRASRSPDYVGLVNSQMNLAVAYIAAGRLEQGIRLEEETLALAKSKLGLKHQETLVLMANLSKAYRDSGRLDLAVPLAEQALELMKASLGTGHPFTIRTMRGQGVRYSDAGQFDHAQPLLEEALKHSKTSLGLDHSETVTSMRMLAGMYQSAGKPAKAQTLFLEIAAKSGDAQLLNALAWNLATSDDSKLRDGPAAVKLAEKAVALTSRKNPEMLDTLAAAYAEVGEFTKAIAAQQEAFALIQDEELKKECAFRLKLYEANSPYRNTVYDASTLAQSAMDLLGQGKLAEAEVVARDCLAIRKKNMPNDWRTFNARSMLGGSLLGQKKYAEAEPLLLSGYEGLKRQEKAMPPQAKPRIRETLQRLIQLYEGTEQAALVTEWKQKLAEFDQPMSSKAGGDGRRAETTPAETKSEAK